MAIKAILIDIDNTILDFNKSADFSSVSLARERGIELPENYSEVFLRINNYLWTEFENGSITKSDIYDRRWPTIFSELGIAADGHSFEDGFRKKMRTVALPVDGADDILSYLAEKYDVYAATNASRLQQENRLRSCGFDKYLKGFFTSEELGFQKPSKEFFALCCEALYPIKKSEIILIGDSINADIIGAKNFGLTTIWFNFDGKEYDTYNFTDYRVNNLCEIKNIL